MKLKRLTALSWSIKRNGLGKHMVGTQFMSIHILKIRTGLRKTGVIYSELILKRNKN